MLDLLIYEDPYTNIERRVTAQANADGNFSGNYPVEERDANVTFIIGAKGRTSGRTAQTTFTDARLWTYTISPSSTSVGTSTTFTLTVTNTGGNCGTGGDSMGSFRATVPVEFTLGTPTIVAPTSKNWTVSRTGQIISAAAATGSGGGTGSGDKLCPGDSIVITISATATTAVGSPFT